MRKLKEVEKNVENVEECRRPNCERMWRIAKK